MPAAVAQEPVALRQHRYFESHDVDDTCIRISTILQPHRLRPTRHSTRVHSHMDFIRFGGAVIGALDFGDEMDVIVEEMEAYYLFVCCLRGHAELNTMGERTTIGQNRGAVCIPGAHFSGRFSPDCEQIFLRVDRATLAAHTGVELMHFDHAMALDRPELSPWVSQFRLLATEPAMLQLAQRDERIAIEFERMLISLLLAGHPHRPLQEPAAPSLAPRAVRRAEAFIDAHACEAIRLADIAAAAEVPARTLLDSFQRFRSCSPMQLVRERRLERARASLLGAGPEARVADIALDCGFPHLGRFAGLYQQRYGESPSETVRRGRRRS